MNKYKISAFVRKIGFIQLLDKIRFYVDYIRTYNKRRNFIKNNPNVILPPAYYLYETYNLNYASYYYNSMDTAKWIINLIEKYQSTTNIKVLDWGCGPGRVIRHIATMLDKSCELHGSDYNSRYVAWCKRHIPEVSFQQNQLAPPMTYENDFFDVVYGISIFTHLSKEMHYKWFNELMRILKPGGMVILTLHGEAFKLQLSEEEQQKFDENQLIIKSHTKEGHRTYGAFHPTQFVHELIGKHELVEHVKGNVTGGKPEQDIWVIRKRG